MPDCAHVPPAGLRPNLAETLDAIVGILRKYLVLPRYAPEAIALWIAHSYALRAADFSPRLVLTSAVMGCGKSTALTLISKLAANPIMAASATSAVLFRVLDKLHPTLLLDEADGWLVGDQGIRTILNAGYCRDTATVLRTNTETFEPEKFDCFGAMAIALIGQPHATIVDRSVVIGMMRRAAADPISRLRRGSIDTELQPVRDALASWSDVACEELRACDPVLPEGLHGRPADLWEPLLAIAQAAGDGWAVRAAKAATALSAQRDDQIDHRLQLLHDLRDVVERMGGTRFSTKDLLVELVRIEEARWSEWKRGKPLSLHQLAELLRPFGLTSVTVRLAQGRTAKGHKLEALQRVFERYLEPRADDTNHNPNDAKGE